MKGDEVAQLVEQQRAGHIAHGMQDVGRLFKSSAPPLKAVVGVAQLVRRQHAAQHEGAAQPRQGIGY